MSRVAIIGYGIVGKAYHKIFPDAVVYDINGIGTKEEANACKLAIVCVPTPMGEDGQCDLTAVQNALIWLETPFILIKSAVVPGTTDYLKTLQNQRICVSPEYVGESKYYVPEEYLDPIDPRKHSFQIIGGNELDTREVVDIFEEYLGPTKRYIQVDARTAELVKYMENCFFATKVTFCNEFYEIAKLFRVDYHKLRECFIADPRVCPMHTSVFKDNRGFGGRCYPKDLSAIIKAAKNKGYSADLLKQVQKSNTNFKKL